MRLIVRTWRHYGLCGVAAVASCVSTTAYTDDVAAFRLTGIEGNVSARYLFDEQSVGQVGLAQASESRTTYEEEIFVLTHSYFYHPNLLKMDLGAGPLFVQNRFESTAGSNRSNDTLYNLTGRLTFLEQKPYPLTVYYEHLNPSVSTGLAQRFLQENDKYGFNFVLRQPLSPVLISIDAFHLRSQGEGIDLVVDDTVEQASLRAYRSFGPDSYGQFLYQSNRQESRSGSPALPIQASFTTTNTANLDSRVGFGERRQFHLNNILSYVTQDFEIAQTPFPARTDLRFTPDLRWDHSDALHSFYRYNLLKSSQGNVDTDNQSATVGLGYRPNPNTSGGMDVHVEDNRTTGLDVSAYGVAGSISYRRPLAIGSLLLSYAGRYDNKDQEATALQVAVFGEQITLVGTTPVALANANVVPGSVVVSNLTRTQVYTEGLDYQVIVIGTQTQVARLVGGNILDGQDVLVDYLYQTGGTFSYTLFDQNYQANLTFLRHYNAYVRYRNAAQDLVSGTPTIVLNSVQSTLYGVRADVPFWREWMVGGEITREHHDEDIAPFDRENYEAYVQVPLPRFSVLRVTGRRVLVDNLTSLEDVDLTGANVHFRSRPWPRSLLTAEASYEEDTGGTLLRRRWGRGAGFEWRIRQLLLRLEGRYVREEQGDFERSRSLVTATVRREF